LTERPPQSWRLPRSPRPIVFIGAGGVVRDAHMPAYRNLRLPVRGVFDVDPKASKKTAEMFGIRHVYGSLAEAAQIPDVVFDVAVPADRILGVLAGLPRGATVLIQKPMGRDLAEAKRILALCRRRELVAAVNFQLRFAPNMLVLRAALAHGRIGEPTDVEVRVNTHTPWELWSFMKGIPRMEILYHSIHYLDLVRWLFGEPQGVNAWARPEPDAKGYADTRSSIQLLYDRALRCTLGANHGHAHGAKHAASHLKVEGTKGAAVAKMGVNLAYPKGEPDSLELAARGKPWKEIPLRGSWFPEAFAGPMSNLQRFAAGEDPLLLTSVEDAIKTMALVEACYLSASKPGTRVPEI